MELNRTPTSQMQLSAELRNVILERNLLTTKTRMKVLSALEDIPKKTTESKESSLRWKAVNEILTSEATYLNHLELIMKYFMVPIQEKNYISPEDYTVIFGNIETIYHVNGELLHELKCNQENIAAAFLKLAPFLKLYSVYAYDYQRALEHLNAKSLDLTEFIKNQENRPEVSTKLISLLITPIQRVPRYCLLLKEVISHTSPSHSDYAVLQDAFQQVESSARHINSLMQEQENMQQVVAIQRCFCKGKPQIVAPGRKFIKAGKLMKVSHKGRKVQPRYFILLSDMLLYCKLRASDPNSANSISCTCVLPLKKCEVHWVMGKTIFKVSCLSENFVLYSATQEESESWVNALQEAVRQFREYRQTLRKGSSSKRPLRGPEINNLWQDSPKLELRRKRTCPSVEDKSEDYSNSPGNQCDFMQFSKATSSQSEPNPSKIRKVIREKTPVLKNSTNESPDSLYPMRNELSKLCQLTSSPSEESIDEGKRDSSNSRPVLKRPGLRARSVYSYQDSKNQTKNEENKENGSGARSGDVWSKCFGHNSSIVDDHQGGERRSTWHNRCLKAMRSFSMNLHQSFWRHNSGLSSKQESD